MKKMKKATPKKKGAAPYDLHPEQYTEQVQKLLPPTPPPLPPANLLSRAKSVEKQAIASSNEESEITEVAARGWGNRDADRDGFIKIDNVVIATIDAAATEGLYIIQLDCLDKTSYQVSCSEHFGLSSKTDYLKLKEFLERIPVGGVIVGASCGMHGWQMPQERLQVLHGIFLNHFGLAIDTNETVAFMGVRSYPHASQMAQTRAGEGSAYVASSFSYESLTSEKPRVTAIDLLKGRGQLRAVNGGNVTLVKKVALDAKAVFQEEKGKEWPDYFPLERLDPFLDGVKTGVHKIDLQFVSQLTDCFFSVLALHPKLELASDLEIIDLTGCPYITDWGISKMVQLFPKLKSVTLVGCTALTETSAHSLMSLANLEYINMSATNLSMLASYGVPADMPMMNIAACSLVSPLFIENPKKTAVVQPKTPGNSFPEAEFKPFGTFKVLSVLPENSELSVITALDLSKGNKPSRSAFVEGVEKGGKIYNIFECSEDLARPLSSCRTLFLLPYDADQDVNKVALSVFTRYLGVLTKVVHPVVVVLGISTSGSPVSKPQDMRQLIERSIHNLLAKVQAKIQRVKKQLFNEDNKYSFSEQRLLSNLFKLEESLQNETGTTQNTMTTYISIKAQDKQSVDEVWNALDGAAQYLDQNHPYYKQLSTELLMAFKFLKKSKILLVPENEVIQGMKANNIFPHGRSGHYAKALEIMHEIGQVVLVDWDEPTCRYVATDPSEFMASLGEAMEQFTSTSQGSSSKPARRKSAVSQLEQKLGIPLHSFVSDVLKLGGTCGGKPVLLKSLDPSPAIPLVEYDPNLHQSFSATFLLWHAVSPMVFCRILHALMVAKSPTLAWASGMVVVQPPAEIRLTLPETEAESYLIKVEVLINKLPGQASEMDPNLAQLGWCTLHTYITVISYVLWNQGFYFTQQVQENGQQVDLPENVYGVVPHHEMFPSADNQHLQCLHCNGDYMTLKKLWNMTSSFQPSVSAPCVDTKDWTVTGSSATCTQKGNPLQLTKLTPGVLDEIHFTFLNKGKLLMEISLWDDNTGAETTHTLASYKEEGCAEVLPAGKASVSMLTLRLTTPQGGFQLDAICDHESVWQHKGSGSVPHPVAIKLMPQTPNFTTIIYAPKAQVKSFGPSAKVWEVGMRLESLDRLNPSLVCASTIAQVSDDGSKVLVHFDGWTNKYDYWTETIHKDLHPIGYMAQADAKYLKGLSNLQKPQKYPKNFDWNIYLDETDAIPVPFSFFNESQTNGVPEFSFTPSVLGRLGSRGLIHGTCGRNRWRPAVFEKTVQDSLSQEVEVPQTGAMCCVLPSNLDATLLTYALPTQVLKWEDLHFLCRKAGAAHFMAQPPLSLSQCSSLPEGLGPALLALKDVLQYVMPQEYIVPDKLATIPGTEAWKLDQLNTAMKQILMNYACFLHAVKKPTPKRKILDELWAEYSGHAAGGDHTSEAAICDAHKLCVSNDANLTDIPMQHFQHHTHLITILNVSQNKIAALPEDFFASFPMLRNLHLDQNELSALPAGIDKCPELTTLNVAKNHMTDLPEELAKCKNLTHLGISHNPMKNFPKAVKSCENLSVLMANALKVTDLPSDIGKLTMLTKLSLADSLIVKLPDSFAQLAKLKDFTLSGISWFDKHDTSTAILSHAAFDEHLNGISAFSDLEKKTRDTLFPSSQGTLSYNEIQLLNVEIYKMFPRLGKDSSQEDAEYGGIPRQIFALPELKRLNLTHQGITVATSHFQQLRNLAKLDMSHNPVLETLPGEFADLPLESLNLRGCPLLKTPPKEIVARGFTTIIAYLKRLQVGSVTCKRTKLMMVGLGGAGKTSLVKALTSGYYQSYGTQGENITDGIDITNWKIQNENDEEITFSVWDFAGQTVYYNTHQFFLSNRAVYFLLWNIRLGYEHAGLEFWLSSISCHAPKAPIFVVGTHSDQVDKFHCPENELMKRYSQIVAFHNVSSYQGLGVRELCQDLLQVALEQKYMGEQIPEAWLNFERHIVSKRRENAIIKWKELESLASNSAIVDKVELSQAVSFLHDLGSLQHFDNDFLKNIVVINPQWIVDVMACVVSVHDSPIQDGRLKHSDIPKVWSSYEESLHEWLLRLTEEFDLTFPIKNESANLVPCLMTEEEPQYDWPDVADLNGVRESKMLYQFDYLPAGLFNRAQVRLYQFSDSSVIWKKGSLLRKNDHMAILKHLRNSQVLVRVQGARPENILYLVHEVLETIIQESFHGVNYEYSIPCTHCLNISSFDPSLFSQKKILRATELKAPFLQCDQYFHTLTLAELHGMMLPTSGADYDVHLQRSLSDLKDLREGLSTDVFMCYCFHDVPQMNDPKRVHPRRIHDDLEQKGLNVWFPKDPHNMDVRQLAVHIMQAKVILFCVSDSFVQDADCRSIFFYATKTLRKKTQLVFIGQTMEWCKSDIGVHISTDVFVKMNEPQKYDSKFKDLHTSLMSKIEGTEEKKEYPPCFISYCWANSRDAIAKGTRQVEGGLGWCDPRDFKTTLGDESIDCWLDIERVGQGGLFEDIADGLRHAKVMVACVSDEYAKSKNCQMELRFASVSLKIPIIIVVVGTGYKWESSEVGMLCLGSPKINLQIESPGGLKRLIDLVKTHMPKEDPEAAHNEATKKDVGTTQTAFRELLELAQWKFLRQIMSYSESMELGSYPRLFAPDFFTSEDIDRLNETLNQLETAEREKIYLNPSVLSPEYSGKPKSVSYLLVPCRHSSPGHQQKTESDCTDPDGDCGQGDSKDRKASPECTCESEPDKECKHCTVNRDGSDTEAARFRQKLGPLEDLEGALCIRVFCEHEEGWHYDSFALPMKLMTEGDQVEFLSKVAPYAARVMAILKHTSLNMAIFNSEYGEQVRRQLEENCPSEVDFKEEYMELRNHVIAADQLSLMGGLSRCHLPNGKTLWLCKVHQKVDRVTVLSSETNVVAHAAMEDDSLMAQEIAKQDALSTFVARASAAEPRALSAATQRKASIRGKLIGAQTAALASAKYKSKNESQLTAAALAAAGKNQTQRKSKACIIM